MTSQPKPSLDPPVYVFLFRIDVKGNNANSRICDTILAACNACIYALSGKPGPTTTSIGTPYFLVAVTSVDGYVTTIVVALDMCRFLVQPILLLQTVSGIALFATCAAIRHTYESPFRMGLSKMNAENYIIIKADILNSAGLKTNGLHNEQ
ncbi:hypothetical protein GQX74_009704 [Glossina fuscipes]|nr:hypothetical protein GQX74_009704 [Glossina fuscipes]